jgi:ligand-binding sensor domain-containing protein/two-component sensor histidine kinase
MESEVSLIPRRVWHAVLATFAFTTFFASSALGLDPTKKLSQCVHQTWTVRNGLPTDELQAITQTRDGYLWIGTEEGLARFDGWNFTVFDKKSGQLPGSFVYRLLEDSSGVLWIGTDGGLVRYTAGKFETVGAEAGLKNTFVYGIAQGEAGSLWVSADYKLWRYRGGVFTCFDPLKQGKDLGGVIDVTVDKKDMVWVILKGGIVCRFSDNHFEPVPEFAMVKGQALERISTDSEGGIWISNFSGSIDHYQNGQVKVIGQSDGLFGSPVSRIIRGRDGIVWLGTELGVARIAEGKCTVFQSSGKDTFGSVNVVFEDREGNLWVGCDGKGLQRFTNGSFTPFGPEEGLPYAAAKGICEDSDHNLWLATSDGIYEGKDRFTRVLSAKDSLGGDFIFAELLPDSRDRSLWIGTMHGLFHYQHDTGALKRYTVLEGLPSNAVFSLCLDTKGSLWIGCDNGLVCLKDGQFAVPEALRLATHGNPIRNVVQDHAGGMWIGTPSGPMLYKGGAITRFGQNDGLAAVSCRGIYVASNGAVWIAPWNGGLSLYTGKGFFTYLQNFGLPSDTVTGLTDDPAQGDLWLGTNKGVLRVSQKQLDDFRAGSVDHIFGTLFGITDGLSSPAIIDDGRPVVTRAYDGKLWWSTNQGIAAVDPDELVLHNTPGPTVIERVIADDRTLTASEPALPSDTRRLEIQYASLTYAAADKMQFRYRLDDVDRGWFDAGQRREAVFTNLGPGHYRFRVQSSADGGASWNEPVAEIGFYVRPHFYETSWFFAVCLAAALGLVCLVFVLRRRSLEAHFRAVIAERVHVASEIHDSLAQGFASAAMLLDSLDRLVPSDSTLQRRLKSVRSILGTSLSDARAMIATLRGQSPANEGLEQALKKLVQRLEPVSPVAITLDLGGEAAPMVSVQVRQELMRICQEGVNNAIQHAHAECICVSLHRDGQGLRLTIRDDGQGFDLNRVTASAGSNHFGLVGLTERAKRIGANLEITSQPGTGTRIELFLPFMKRRQEPPGSLSYP